ncbi:unnamed protein product [Bursaphelenchus xylophilus]|uniref:(pine wood nematode) hypothetical protein n=1 Tax=Bursaphelenchus xylophilus TaxID=6326 RepID=A0A1I7SGR6_BURXY|nr:unnamed protein product [Bursaphelenchus xylophilus]CAG9088343.1 unnamed protein product [Bursaphelenchus xylophilus]
MRRLHLQKVRAAMLEAKRAKEEERLRQQPVIRARVAKGLETKRIKKEKKQEMIKKMKEKQQKKAAEGQAKPVKTEEALDNNLLGDMPHHETEL